MIRVPRRTRPQEADRGHTDPRDPGETEREINKINTFTASAIVLKTDRGSPLVQ